MFPCGIRDPGTAATGQLLGWDHREGAGDRNKPEEPQQQKYIWFEKFFPFGRSEQVALIQSRGKVLKRHAFQKHDLTFSKVPRPHLHTKARTRSSISPGTASPTTSLELPGRLWTWQPTLFCAHLPKRGLPERCLPTTQHPTAVSKVTAPSCCAHRAGKKPKKSKIKNRTILLNIKAGFAAWEVS